MTLPPVFVALGCWVSYNPHVSNLRHPQGGVKQEIIQAIIQATGALYALAK
jgi:hypothetical protein